MARLVRTTSVSIIWVMFSTPLHYCSKMVAWIHGRNMSTGREESSATARKAPVKPRDGAGERGLQCNELVPLSMFVR